MSTNATSVVRRALAGSGVDLVASCSVEAYDARAPDGFRSASLWPGASALIVVGSAGPQLWRQFRERMDADAERWDDPHPLDAFVRGALARADAALSSAGVPFRRFEPSVTSTPRLDFVAMARLVGLGSPGPFGILIHTEHGAWWALRGAWLVRADVDGPLDHRRPCAGCTAPCVGGWANAPGHSSVAAATREVRMRCVAGGASRYDDDQIAYHYEHEATVARLRKR
jgi:epoxyqueuosine reductase QueG